MFGFYLKEKPAYAVMQFVVVVVGAKFRKKRSVGKKEAKNKLKTCSTKQLKKM